MVPDHHIPPPNKISSVLTGKIETIEGKGTPLRITAVKVVEAAGKPNRSAALTFTNREASNVGVGSSLGRLCLAGNFCLLPDIERRVETKTN